MGSKSTHRIMKSIQHIQSEAPGATSKKENALGIISKSMPGGLSIKSEY